MLFNINYSSETHRDHTSVCSGDTAVGNVTRQHDRDGNEFFEAEAYLTQETDEFSTLASAVLFIQEETDMAIGNMDLDYGKIR